MPIGQRFQDIKLSGNRILHQSSDIEIFINQNTQGKFRRKFSKLMNERNINQEFALEV